MATIIHEATDSHNESLLNLDVIDAMITSQDIKQRSRTKIVATVGPACFDPAVLTQLVLAGVDVFRLNMAHGTPAEQQIHVENIRRISKELGHPIAILVDLAGPKFRLGPITDDNLFCKRDDTFYFVPSGTETEPNELTSSYEPLISELSLGDEVMLADGSVSMLVTEKSSARITMRVTQQGTIRSRQGINLPGIKLSVPAISVKDYEHAIWAAKAGVDFVSLSFVRAPDEIRALKDILRSNNSTAQVIAKIEKREALERLDEIVEVSDAIMVARGDLGVEIDVAQMPVEQKRIITTCQRLQTPTIIATQMLESMHESRRPTRAEVTDVANAVLDGADATMLSGETAIGKHPVAAVDIMNRIALATEASIQDRPPRDPELCNTQQLHQITRAVVHGAGVMAHSLRAKLVFVASHSGKTALALSQQRSFVPTIGVSSSEETLRMMGLYWGVTPLPGVPATNIQELIRFADKWACKVGFAKKGDRIVIVGGSHLTWATDENGVHDAVIVHEVEDL